MFPILLSPVREFEPCFPLPGVSTGHSGAGVGGGYLGWAAGGGEATFAAFPSEQLLHIPLCPRKSKMRARRVSP